jgi:uncharacterized Zn finger protein
MTPTLQFILSPSSRTRKTQLPECSRCQLSIAQPILEKEAGELIVRCVECNAINVLRLAIIDPMAILSLEVTGWKE